MLNIFMSQISLNSSSIIAFTGDRENHRHAVTYEDEHLWVILLPFGARSIIPLAVPAAITVPYSDTNK